MRRGLTRQAAWEGRVPRQALTEEGLAAIRATARLGQRGCESRLPLRPLPEGCPDYHLNGVGTFA